MDDMPRPRPPHLHRELTRHGKAVWHVRIGHGPRIRIRAAFGTPEFDAEYQAAIAGNQHHTKAGTAIAGTLAWLIERFRETPAWLSLSPATRSKRENIFRQIIETAGRQPFKAITESTIAAGRDRRGKTAIPGPALSRHDARLVRLGQGSRIRQIRSSRRRQISAA